MATKAAEKAGLERTAGLDLSREAARLLRALEGGGAYAIADPVAEGTVIVRQESAGVSLGGGGGRARAPRSRRIKRRRSRPALLHLASRRCAPAPAGRAPRPRFPGPAPGSRQCANRLRGPQRRGDARRLGKSARLASPPQGCERRAAHRRGLPPGRRAPAPGSDACRHAAPGHRELGTGPYPTRRAALRAIRRPRPTPRSRRGSASSGRSRRWVRISPISSSISAAS